MVLQVLQVQNSWFLLHDNAPTHHLMLKMCLAKHNVTAWEHPPYAPDLSLPGFVPVSTTGKCFKCVSAQGNHFEGNVVWIDERLLISV
jgi:hypothetical protein